MFTMAKIKNGGTYLSHHLTANDYYCENETVVGQWVGRGAEKLNLHGEIKAGDAAFENLRNNRHPNGAGKLTPRDGNDRVKFFDFQCSAQKSISVMAVTMGDTRLLAAHDAAAALAFGELEKFAARQENTFAWRANRRTSNVVAAAFRHTASRALDPQVHTHFVTANATWDLRTKPAFSPTSPNARRYTDRQRAQIVALAAEPPPVGFEHWTLPLLARELVGRGIIDEISGTTVQTILTRAGATIPAV